LRERVRELSMSTGITDEIAKLREEVKAIDAEPKTLVARMEVANAKAERLLSNDAIETATRRAADIADVYRATWSMMSTLEMVIYAVSRSHELQEQIKPGEAATKLVRLMGFGAEYFQKREHWTIENWVDHLAHATERNFPSGGYESTPVSEYTLNR
jgi:hypothetical protein